MGSFLLTRVRFGSLNRCGVLKQRDYLNELFDNPHIACNLLTKSPIWFRHHETPQFYKSSVCEPSVHMRVSSWVLMTEMTNWVDDILMTRCTLIQGFLAEIGHFLQKSPVISGSFIEKDLQLGLFGGNKQSFLLWGGYSQWDRLNCRSLLQNIVSFIGFFCKRDL